MGLGHPSSTGWEGDGAPPSHPALSCTCSTPFPHTSLLFSTPGPPNNVWDAEQSEDGRSLVQRSPKIVKMAKAEQQVGPGPLRGSASLQQALPAGLPCAPSPGIQVSLPDDIPLPPGPPHADIWIPEPRMIRATENPEASHSALHAWPREDHGGTRMAPCLPAHRPAAPPHGITARSLLNSTTLLLKPI